MKLFSVNVSHDAAPLVRPGWKFHRHALLLRGFGPDCPYRAIQTSNDGLVYDGFLTNNKTFLAKDNQPEQNANRVLIAVLTHGAIDWPEEAYDFGMVQVQPFATRVCTLSVICLEKDTDIYFIVHHENCEREIRLHYDEATSAVVATYPPLIPRIKRRSFLTRITDLFCRMTVVVKVPN